MSVWGVQKVVILRQILKSSLMIIKSSLIIVQSSMLIIQSPLMIIVQMWLWCFLIPKYSKISTAVVVPLHRRRVGTAPRS